MNEAEGVQDESGITLPESIPESEEEDISLEEKWHGVHEPSLTPAWMFAAVKTSSSCATQRPLKSVKRFMMRQFEVRSCALGGHAQRSPSWR